MLLKMMRKYQLSHFAFNYESKNFELLRSILFRYLTDLRSSKSYRSKINEFKVLLEGNRNFSRNKRATVT